MTLTFGSYKSSFRWLHISTLNVIGYNSFTYIHSFAFFPYNNLSDHWPCQKIDQGQPRVIIKINFLKPEYPMVHTKFQGHWPFISWEEDFQKFLPYMGLVAILITWPRSHEQTLIPPSNSGSTFNLVSVSPAVLEVNKKRIPDLRHPGQRSIDDLDLWYL